MVSATRNSVLLSAVYKHPLNYSFLVGGAHVSSYQITLLLAEYVLFCLFFFLPHRQNNKIHAQTQHAETTLLSLVLLVLLICIRLEPIRPAVKNMEQSLIAKSF